MLLAIFAILISPLAISGKEKEVCGADKQLCADKAFNLLWVIKHENKNKKWYLSFMDEISYYNFGHVVMGHELTKGPVEAKDDFEPFDVYDHIHRKVHISANGHVRTFKDHVKVGKFAVQDFNTKAQPYDDKDLDKNFDVVAVEVEDNYAIIVVCWHNSKEQSWVVVSPRPINEKEQNETLDLLKKKLGFERKGYSFKYQDTDDN